MSRGSRQGALERPRCRQKVLPCLDLRAGTLSSSMLAQAWRCEPISPVTGSKPRASTFHFSLINLWVAKARHQLGACHRLHPGSYVLSLDLDWHRPVLTLGSTCPIQRSFTSPSPCHGGHQGPTRAPGALRVTLEQHSRLPLLPGTGRKLWTESSGLPELTIWADPRGAQISVLSFRE